MPELRCISSAARPARPTPDPEPHLFTTPNTNLGALFVATKKLRYIGAKMASERDGVGSELSNECRMGTAGPVQPKALFDGQKFLRDEVSRVRMGVANAKPTQR